ncbi:unnamed protein product [Brachionus calyciflorus]|uniref:LTD domain-containing protein n=1 Tax=Brachionus calyciflorus TaxID=104777 RepID=A0A813V632_9BILA|nr:unnamed protein product [Brachionus calyciflorus]
MSIRTTRTIERGVRTTPKSLSTTNLAVPRGSMSHRSSSPIEHVKEQITAFVGHSLLEKSELSKLNNRMANYVNTVKVLENENTNLANEINDRQNNWGEETRRVRDKYEQSLFDVRGQIDEVANLKTSADVRNKRAQYENIEYQRRVEDTLRAQNSDKNKILNLERELNQLGETKLLMSRSLQDALNDIEKYRQHRDDTWLNLVDLLNTLDDELYRRIAVEYNNQTLREHIEFIKQVNEKELQEMNQLSNILPFNDQVEFYKDQLKRVITNIRNDYEALNVEQQREMEEWMKVKQEEINSKARAQDPIHELEMNIQIENLETLRDNYDNNSKELDHLKHNYDSMAKRLQDLEQHVDSARNHMNETLEKQDNEIKNLNDDLGNLIDDYNNINSHKASLEYEIQVYKRLLDSQLERFAPTNPESTPKLENQTIVSSNQLGGKVQNKKEKKGSVGISDSSPDGKYIKIENTGSNNTPVDISGWTIKRKVDSNGEISYKLPQGVVLPPNKELVIWADSYRANRNQNDLITDFDNWGIGINSTTRLVNQNGEEKSSFSQQISFSSQY